MGEAKNQDLLSNAAARDWAEGRSERDPTARKSGHSRSTPSLRVTARSSASLAVEGGRLFVFSDEVLGCLSHGALDCHILFGGNVFEAVEYVIREMSR
jgi:hypothetical protein